MEKGVEALGSELCNGQWVIDPAGVIDLVQLFVTTYPELVSAQPQSGTCQKCWQQLIKAKKGFSSMKGIVKEIRLSDFMSTPLCKCVVLVHIFFLA